MSDQPDELGIGKEPTLGQVLVALNRLADKTDRLTDKLTVSTQQAFRTRVLTVIVAVLVTAMIVVGYLGFNRISDSVDANHQTQVQQCQNANSVRVANVTLWTTFISLLTVNAKPEVKLLGVELLTWITKLYEQHDCNDLNRVYTPPPPPDFSKFIKKQAAT